MRSATRRHGARRRITALLAAPLGVRIAVGAAIVLAGWLAVNWAYQVIRKPSELLFPVSAALAKAPADTWRHYGPLFRQHATRVITPDLLAALAQIESTGNPAARTYWRWRLGWNPLEVYRPASSAVGLYQITDAAFEDAERYRIRGHAAVTDPAWYEPGCCWVDRVYRRVVPGHAIELTATYLDRAVAETLARRRMAAGTLQQRQDLAGIIHLCGASAGEAYAGRGFRLRRAERCGDHAVSAYLGELNAMKRRFRRLASASS